LTEDISDANPESPQGKNVSSHGPWLRGDFNAQVMACLSVLPYSIGSRYEIMRYEAASVASPTMPTWIGRRILSVRSQYDRPRIPDVELPFQSASHLVPRVTRFTNGMHVLHYAGSAIRQGSHNSLIG
jgi:hypothetical protein